MTDEATSVTEEPPYAPYLRYLSQVPKINLVLIGLWIIASVWLFFAIPIPVYADSAQYFDVSDIPLFPLTNFIYADRAFTVPLLLKLFPSEQAMTSFQLALFIFSWGFLFLLVSDVIKPAILSGLCIFFLSMVSLSWIFFFWNRAIMSESVSFSGFVLVFALLCRFLLSPRPSRLLVYSIVPVWVLWNNSRDSNAYYSLCVALIFFAAFAIHALREKTSRKWKEGMVIMGLVLCFTAVQISAEADARREELNMVNIIGQRILPYPDRTADFVRLGMPLNEKVLCFRGKFYWNCSQDYSGFGTWLKSTAWKWAYTSWLLNHITDYDLKTMIMDSDIIWTRDIESTHVDIQTPPFSAFASTIGLPRGEALIVFALAVLAAFLTACFHIIKSRFRHWILTPAVMLAGTLPLTFICYHGDAGGVDRHCLDIQLNFYVIGWVVIFWLISDLSGNKNILKKLLT
ncbi:MAG: hypothetical protein KGI29_07775 [Pseudomonadota bacterium]|nr:hypothetical protein [Pseudomonadota bacterium]MDE3037274.1 hypothetical protein [Pseudomonadota bacterium]